MSDQFDPNWPHGHDLLSRGGCRKPARILAFNATHNTRNIVFEWEYEPGGWGIDRASATGEDAAGWRLVNRPAPEPVVKKTLNHVVGISHRELDGFIYYAEVKVSVDFLSDGFVRASAEVVK